MDNVREFTCQIYEKCLLPQEMLLHKAQKYKTTVRLREISTAKEVVRIFMDNVLAKAKNMEHVFFLIDGFNKNIQANIEKHPEENARKAFSKIKIVFAKIAEYAKQAREDGFAGYDNGKRKRLVQLLSHIYKEIRYPYEKRFAVLNEKYPDKNKKGSVLWRLHQTKLRWSNIVFMCKESGSYSYSVYFLCGEFGMYAHSPENFKGCELAYHMSYSKKLGEVLDYIEQSFDEVLPRILMRHRQYVKDWHK
jgi:hypothetical protein|nr:MAG TPA: hypothetical protein [Caudoviricetes sp.]